MNHRAIRPLPALATLLLAANVLPSDATGQVLRVDGIRAWSDHDRLGSPAGLSVSVGERPLDLIGVRLGFEAYRDAFRSSGTTCVGLVPRDEDCAVEPRDERGRFLSVVLSVPVYVFSKDWGEMSLVPGVRTAWLDSEQEGLRTGRTREAEKRMYGWEVGVEAAVLLPSSPLRIHLGGHAGELRPYEHALGADGYTPFEGAIGVDRLQLGLSLSL